MSFVFVSWRVTASTTRRSHAWQASGEPRCAMASAGFEAADTPACARAATSRTAAADARSRLPAQRASPASVPSSGRTR